MSQTSPIMTLTLNTALHFTVSVQCDRVRIVNDSSVYLLVYFGREPPSATDPTSTGWNETISPGARPVITVTGAPGQDWWRDHSYAIDGPFDGNIWVLPFLPSNQFQPSGGTLFGASYCYVTSFLQGEPAADEGQVEAFVQAVKQSRMQAVLGSILPVALVTDETFGAANKRVGLLTSVTSANMPNHFAANAEGASLMNVYIWFYLLTMIPTNVDTASTDITLFAGLYNSTGVTLKSTGTSLGTWSLRATGNFSISPLHHDRTGWSLANPMISRISIPQGTLVSGDTIQIFASSANVSGAFTLRHNIGFLVDAVNQSKDEALSSQNTSNQAWSAFNPQAF
jgi:hypothetical protein